MHLWFRLSKIVASVALLQKGIFYFFDNVRKFHETFRGKVCFVNYIIPVLNWFNWFFWNRKIKISVLLTFKAIELDLIGQNLFFLLRSLRELLAYSRYGSSDLPLVSLHIFVNYMENEPSIKFCGVFDHFSRTYEVRWFCDVIYANQRT